MIGGNVIWGRFDLGEMIWGKCDFAETLFWENVIHLVELHV